ncbi:MAG: hypothetical protein LBI29_02010 [Rickettsiales bacterium]|jgi:hypothetical protein|nr:hypothetical protein [Rickettsiales bacterium]
MKKIIGTNLLTNKQGKTVYTITFDNEDIVKGDLKLKINNKYEIKFEDGSSYIGDMKNEKFDGTGTYKSKFGSTYVGEFRKGMPDGKGEHIFAKSGAKYVGNFREGVMHGSGEYHFSSGAKYIGELEDGKINGVGAYINAAGRIFVGHWKNGKKIGKGIVLDNNGPIKYVEYNDKSKDIELGTLLLDKNGHIASAPNKDNIKMKLDEKLINFLSALSKGHPGLLDKYISAQQPKSDGLPLSGPSTGNSKDHIRSVRIRSKTVNRGGRKKEGVKGKEKKEEDQKIRKREIEKRKKEEESKKIAEGIVKLTKNNDGRRSKGKILHEDEKQLENLKKKGREIIRKNGEKGRVEKENKEKREAKFAEIDKKALGLALTISNLDKQFRHHNKSNNKYKRYPNATYHGEQDREGREHGLGTMEWRPSGSRYNGYWMNGQCHGIGAHRSSDGFVYEGEWKNGKRDGFGIQIDKNGSIYKGYWGGDKRDGFGIQVDQNGSIYKGEWKNGNRHGVFIAEEKSEGGILIPSKIWYNNGKVMKKWTAIMSKDSCGPGKERLPLRSKEEIFIDGRFERTSTIIYHSRKNITGQMDRSIKVNFSLFNKVMNEGRVKCLDDLVSLGVVTDITEGVKKLTKFTDLKEHLVSNNILNFIDRKAKKDDNMFTSGTSSEQYVIQLIGAESLEELYKMRFQEVGLSTKKNLFERMVQHVGLGNDRADIDSCYRNISSLLGSIGISNLDSIKEDYIVVQLDTLKKNHAVSAIIDIKKLKDLRTKGINIDRTEEKFLYIYDTGGIIDSHADNNLGNLMKNSKTVSQNQQKGGSCWFNAAITAIAAAQNNDAVKDISEQRGNTALEIKQMLTMQEFSKKYGIVNILDGKSTTDYVVDDDFRERIINLAKKEKILNRIEQRVQNYLASHEDVLKFMKHLGKKFKNETNTASGHSAFQKSLDKLDKENELLRALDSKLGTHQRDRMAERVNNLGQNLNTMNSLNLTLANSAVDHVFGIIEKANTVGNYR